MRAQISAVLMTGAILAGGTVFLSHPAWTQNIPVQDASAKPIGKVVSAKGTATIEHGSAAVVVASLGNQRATVTVGQPVYLGDILQTGADGKLGIAFADGTAFDVSANARMVLDSFVYDPNGHANSSFFSLTKGAFTFVAGKIAKTGDMKIDTPVATMGIRGTTPHVEVLSDGTVKFMTLLEEGKAEVAQKYSGGSPPTPAPREKLNLNICRGC
jgi:hypothetical protein